MSNGGLKMVVVHRCGQRYIHIALKVVHRVMPWGLGGWVADPPLRCY